MAPATRPTAYEANAPDPRLVTEALAGSAQSVYWLDDTAGADTYPPLPDATAADLAIVGGGYLGLWTAIHAKRRDPGRRVVLLEAETIGWTASGRNGGFCEASLTHGEENGRSRWPDEHPLLEQLGRSNLDAFGDDVVDLGLDCDWERTGVTAIAVEPHQLPWLGTGDGVLDQDRARARIDSPLVLGAVYEPDDCALVHPAKLAHELARVATEATEPLSAGRLASIGWAGREGLTDLGNQFHYSRLTKDNRILYGGYDAIYHPGRKVRAAYEDRPASHRRLASHLLATFPQLEGIRVTHPWAGAIDTSTRFTAFYGLARAGRVAYAAGFTGLGVGATRFAAEVLLDLLGGETTERSSLEMVRRKPWPFPPEPLASLGINLTRWSLDRADHRQGHRNLFLRALDAVGLGFDS